MERYRQNGKGAVAAGHHVANRSGRLMSSAQVGRLHFTT